MTDSKKRIYLALTAFCLLALFLDRVVLTDGGSGPARVEASPVADPAVSEVEPFESPPIPTIAFPPVAADLAGHPPRDFFASPPSSTPAGSSGNASDEKLLLRLAFEEAAKLDGLMVTATGGVAVVNGRRMAPGDSLLGCKLEKVFGRSAHFRCSDGVAVLFIAPRSSKASN